MEEAPGWTCRAYEPGDEDVLAPLFEKVFGRSLTPQRWRAKVAPDSTEIENAWVAVDKRGRPIAQYAGIPRIFRGPWGERSVMIAIDALTAPEFRRQGVLTQLVSHAHKAWRAAGVAFVLGLPNEQWGSRIDAVGWQYLFPLQWRLRPLQPERMVARKIGLRGWPKGGPLSALWNAAWRRRLTTELIESSPLTARLGEEWNPLAPEGGMSAVRSDAWLARRFGEWPDRSYQLLLARSSGTIAGYSAYRLQEEGSRRVGFLAEVAANSDVASELLTGTIAWMHEREAEMVCSLAVRGSPLSALLSRHGFLPSRRAFSVHAVPLADMPALEQLRRPEHWWLSGGDFDVI